VKYKEQALHLKGIFTYQEVLKVLREFINKYILCTTCTLPELSYQSKDKKVRSKCMACGNSDVYSFVDRTWKLIGQTAKPRKQEKQKKQQKKHQQETLMSATQDDTFFSQDLPEDDEVEWGVEMTEEAMEQRRQAELGESAVSGLVQ